MVNYNIKGYEKQNLLLSCYKESKAKKNKINSSKINSDKINTSIDCNKYLNEDKMKEILIPRYNKWIKINEFE